MKLRSSAFPALATFALAAAIATSPSTGASHAALPVNDAAILSDAMPRTLAEYGFFADAPRQQPAQGVIPYELNTPLFSDGASKLRFAYVPPGMQALAEGEGLIRFPVGSALIKTFAFGEDADLRLIETRVLLHRADGWVALPYRWNEEQTEARLAIAGGRLDIEVEGRSTLSYRIPNKNQCKQCHSIGDTLTPIGPKARNLGTQWLADFVAAGHLDQLPPGSDTVPLWSARAEVPIEQAARGYLDVNCAHCHQPNGKASNSGLDLRWEQHDPTAYGIRKRPVAAGQGSGGLEFSIVPGDPASSIIVYRMSSTNPGVAMPELGKSTIDEEGLALVSDWIEGMPR